MTEFGSSAPFTVGVEEEHMLVDPDDGSLVDAIDDVRALVDGDLEGHVHAEFYQCMVETVSDVCRDVDEVHDEVHRLRRSLRELADDVGCALASAGAHPTGRWEDQSITDEPRYHETVDLVGWPARFELVCGQHVHVGVPSASSAIYIANWIRPYLPLVLALSANSPFWKGEDTGLVATRMRVFDAMPRTGMPRAFDGWEDYRSTLDLLMRTGGIEDFTRLWWDVRPRPDVGTVEVRMADSLTDPDVSLAIASLVQALALHLHRRHEDGADPPLPHDHEVVRENRWRAIKDGPDADLIRRADPEPGTIPAREAAREVLDLVTPEAEELGLEDALLPLWDRSKGAPTGAERMLEVRDRTGDLDAVVMDLLRRTGP